MSNIKEITLYNFKASYGETKIELDGKNLLMYGENGSGKSSVYWALYTLLQSSNKSEEEIKKYFDPSNDEHLINLSYLEPQVNIDPIDNARLYPLAEILDSYVEVKLENNKIFRIDKEGVTTSDLNLLQSLNRNSDFISHRLLINFYNFRNSKKINLWEVFVRDIFPFIKTDRGNSEKTLSDELKELENNQPFINLRIHEFQLSSSTRLQNLFIGGVNRFNDDVSYWLYEINTKVNNFYTSNFKNSGDKEIKISLSYTIPLKFDKVFPQFFKGKERWYNYVGFNNPHIELKIELENEDGTFTEISKPQSYFNEAKLTSIALSVRFSLLSDFIRPHFEGKFLALDDLLVSLDMSNRDKVLDIILNEFAPKYKIYLFTHERSFFNMVKRRLANRNLLEDWNIKEVFMNDFINPSKPIIVDNKDYLSLALYHLKNFDLPAAANYLRKECEFLMKYLLPDNLAKKETDENTKYNQLENLITNFLKYYSETLNQNITNLLILKEKKDLILNPLSHDNLDSEIYKDELLSFHNLLLEMRKIKKYIILKSDEEFYFNQIDHDGDICRYNVKTIENIIFYKVLDGSLVCKNSLCEFTIQEKQGQKIQLNHPTKFMDLQKVAYNHALKTTGLHTYPDKLLEFTNIESKTFQELINEFDV